MKAQRLNDDERQQWICGARQHDMPGGFAKLIASIAMRLTTNRPD